MLNALETIIIWMIYATGVGVSLLIVSAFVALILAAYVAIKEEETKDKPKGPKTGYRGFRKLK